MDNPDHLSSVKISIKMRIEHIAQLKYSIAMRRINIAGLRARLGIYRGSTLRLVEVSYTSSDWESSDSDEDRGLSLFD